MDLGAWSAEKYRIASRAFDESEVEEESAIQSPRVEPDSDE
jgi:endogenous inhibitor of DNA gyrase (YacG/DUF329 family)